MNPKTKRMLLRLAGLLLLGYVGLYGILRFQGFITHYENRGMDTGHEVKARVSQWAGLFPEIAVLESAAVHTVNFFYYPVMKIEGVCQSRRDP